MSYRKGLAFSLKNLNSQPLRTRRLFSSAVNSFSKGSVQQVVAAEVSKAISEVFGAEYFHCDPLVFPSKATQADYQSNIAMPLSKQLRIPPKEVATKLAASLSQSTVLANVDISGPGFVNMHVGQQFMRSRFFEKVVDLTSRIGIAPSTTKSKIIVDFSSPNIAKEMHVGHLRSTIIGDCLSRVLEFLGHDVLRINHVGDWGTQFGMLIHHLKCQYPQLSSSNGAIEFPRLNIADVVKLYKESKQLFDTDDQFKELARLEVVKLQKGDQVNNQLWQWLCQLSRHEYDEIYSLLKIDHLVERGESFYNPMLSDLLLDLKKKQLCEESDGAAVIFLEGYKNKENMALPLIIQKADGGYLYATTDLAALKYRIEKDGADRIIYVTDAGQAQHFQMVFDAARKAQILPESVSVTHVPFGLVLGADGKKISSRKKGDSVRLKDLLDEAIELAKGEFVARDKLLPASSSSGESKNIACPELERKAQIMGIAAIKYADLSMNRESNYRFSLEKMLSLQGNTAPYMLYAFVRIRGILRKLSQFVVVDEPKKTIFIRGGENIAESVSLEDVQRFERQFRGILNMETLVFLEASEVQLLKHLLRSDEVLYEVGDKLYPHKICEYLFDLSQKFNTFYEKCSVIHASSEEVRMSRIALCLLTSDVLKLYLQLLGIETVEEL